MNNCPICKALRAPQSPTDVVRKSLPVDFNLLFNFFKIVTGSSKYSVTSIINIESNFFGIREVVYFVKNFCSNTFLPMVHLFTSNFLRKNHSLVVLNYPALKRYHVHISINFIPEEI